MSKVIKTRDGKTVTLLNPAEKGDKYAKELRTGKRFTNDGKPKKGKNGQQLKVTKNGRAYRGGYLDARNDNAAAFNDKKKRK